LNLERDFCIPECHLHLIGKRLGILGHPKCLYDTILNLNGSAVLKMDYSDNYDPFLINRRCFIGLQTSSDFIGAKRYEMNSSLIILLRNVMMQWVIN
jgi:hypothetical protein